MQLSREERLLKLDSISNIRDLGGYETQDGKFTKSHKFLRSAVMSTISEQDLECIYNYGVRVVVDLRSEDEIAKEPNKMNGYKDVVYIHHNLMNMVDVNVVPDVDVSDMGDMYISMAKANQQQYKELFEIFHKYNDSCIVFNCSAGKDRTGTTAALLLDIAGCYRQDIIKDYSETFENNKAIYDKLKDMVPEHMLKMLLSEPEYMDKYLTYLYDTYGSGKGFLLACGVTEEIIADIVENFTI